MTDPLRIALDRTARRPLGDQIHAAIRDGVREGRLAPGARLPSWRDLAVQLGVARGTVRAAYERLAAEQVVVGRGAAGTFVAAVPPASAPAVSDSAALPAPDLFRSWDVAPLIFQPGVPAQDAFPATIWSRLTIRAAREAAAAPATYPDPRGDPALRREIAGYLGVARGLACGPGQVIVTAGYAGALGVVAHALGLKGATAWTEEPGFPLTRMALELAGLDLAPVPVDQEGLDVAAGVRRAPDAVLAVVTPGQQAPLGVTMSPARRRALLDWAARSGAWVLEDDYLGELQLRGRAAPSLAGLDRAGRVIYAGTFSKTLSPALRLGFLVVPEALVHRFAEIAVALAPAPALATQRAVASFLAEGRFLRHLRRMKRLYAARQAALLAALAAVPSQAVTAVRESGSLAVRIEFADGVDDRAIADAAAGHGLGPTALSPWYAGDSARAGLLLGVPNAVPERLPAAWARLSELLAR